MYIRGKQGKEENKFVCINPSNFDAISIDKRGNITCVLNGKIVSLGVYPKLDEESYPGLIEMLFQEIWENIETKNVYIMPNDEEGLDKKIKEWAVNNKNNLTQEKF